MLRKKAEEISETEKMLETVILEKTEKSQDQQESVTFPCPGCGKGKIKRTFHERQLASKYICDKCGFEGPN